MVTMKITGYSLFTFFLIVLVTACAKVPDELNRAEALIETHPDSALSVLKSIIPTYIKYPAKRAFYGLLMIETFDRLKFPLSPDSLLNYSLNYYQKQNNVLCLVRCYLYRGRMDKYNLVRMKRSRLGFYGSFWSTFITRK